MKRIIRNLSLWFNDVTRKWVIPSSVWEKLHKGDVSAQIDLLDISSKWGNLDPEFIRADLTLRRIESNFNRHRQR